MRSAAEQEGRFRAKGTEIPGRLDCSLILRLRIQSKPDAAGVKLHGFYL